MPKISRSIILLVKHLIGKDYEDKHISMITKVSRSYINKIRKNQFRVDDVLKDGEEIVMTVEQEKRLNTLNKILAVPELMIHGTSEQDLIYIHVLRFFGVPKEEVFNLYFHLSKKQFGRLWMKGGVDILQFDSRIIGIEIRDYADLVIDFFI